MYLPLYVNIEGKKILIIGLGEVGKRRAKKMKNRGAEVKGIDRTDPGLEGIEFEKKKLEKGDLPDLDDYFLVVASTDDEELNRYVAEKAVKQGVLVSCAGDFEEGDVLFPGVVEINDESISITTKGKDPALTKRIKEVIKDEFSKE